MNQLLVIFSPIVQWPVHFETDLEIAQRHLDQGGTVTFLYCRGTLPICAQNPYHHKSICRKCVSRFKNGIRWLGKDHVSAVEFQLLTEEQKRVIDTLTAEPFSSLNELKEFTLEGAPLGLAAVGSMVSFLREPKPDLRLYQSMFTAYLQAAGIAFFSIKNQLTLLNPDTFVLFNGRFAELRAAFHAAQSIDVPTYVHERAGILERYSLLLNTTPHDLAAIKTAINSTYLESSFSEEEKKAIATEWYEERRNNKAQSWYSFTANQDGRLLPNFSLDRLNLVIFNSSEDEIESFDDWRNPFYVEQNEGIEKIVAGLSGDQRFKLFLRVHPNLKNIMNSQMKGIEQIDKLFPELEVIPADSPMSSYGILDACDIVLVFGSTIGIEAAYTGKPSFLMGRAFYEDLGCSVTPRSHDDLMKLLSLFAEGELSMLPPKGLATLAVVKFGLFQKLWGEPYKYVRPCHVGKSVLVRNMKETSLRPSIVSWLIDKIVTYLAR